MDAETVANDLAKHEAVCAERWKTAFNRFDDLDENVKRIETILISAAGTIIVAGCGLIVTLWMNHMQEKTMEMDYDKKDITKAPKVKKVVKKEPVLPAGAELSFNGTAWRVKFNGETKMYKTKEEAIEWLTK